MQSSRKPTIIHPTDFSPVGDGAFSHALRLALALKGRLFLLHVESEGDDGDEPHWDDFPGVRARLARWGLLEAGAPQSAVRDRLGIDVAKFDFRQSSAPHAVEAFAHDHGADLMVLGTRGLTGFDRWLEGSMAERIADRLRVRTLFVSGHARGFVDSETGAMRLSRILFPVDSTPDPEPAYGELEDWLRELDVSTRAVRAVHAGATPPRLRHGLAREQLKVEQIAGPAVEGIVDAAADADLIVMPTQGRQGFLDLLRGSTTQRVLRRAPCPVLAIPEAGDRSRDDDD